MNRKNLNDDKLLRGAVGGQMQTCRLTMHQAIKAIRICFHCRSTVNSNALSQTVYGCRCPNCGEYFVDIGKLELRMEDERDILGRKRKRV